MKRLGSEIAVIMSATQVITIAQIAKADEMSNDDNDEPSCVFNCGNSHNELHFHIALLC